MQAIFSCTKNLHKRSVGVLRVRPRGRVSLRRGEKGKWELRLTDGCFVGVENGV